MNTNKEVYQILEELAATTKKNEKEDILTLHKDNGNLRECFRLAYSPTINFFMRQIPEYSEGVTSIGMESILEDLQEYLLEGYRGAGAKEFISNLLTNSHEEYRQLIINILQGDLRCGVGKATINKVWKGLIVTPPRMGAKSMSEKSLNALSNKRKAVELKSDGSYLAFNGNLMSRNGNPVTVESLEEHLNCGAFEGFALEGEGIYDLTKATREEGNGIIGKIIKNTATSSEKGGLIYQVWDCIDTRHYKAKGKYRSPNFNRRTLLECMLEEYQTWCTDNKLQPKIQIIPRTELVSLEEAMEIFEGYVRDGFEGAILKDMDSFWVDNGKPSSCVKLKRKDRADLLVTGVYEGKDKAEGMLGGVSLESSEGLIKTNCGSGFSDSERKMFWDNPNLILGKILEVEYDSVTEDKKTKQKSLFLPIYKGVRDDKLDADNYEEILAKVSIK